MNRIIIDGSAGTWFDSDSAIRFAEATYWDGRNHISVNTGSQWNHEALFRTKGGKWVLNSWSQWQGGRDSYSVIDDNDAARWLSANKCQNDESYADLPASIRAMVENAIADKEI